MNNSDSKWNQKTVAAPNDFECPPKHIIAAIVLAINLIKVPHSSHQAHSIFQLGSFSPLRLPIFFPFFHFIDPNPITRWRRYFAPLFMCHKCDFYRENFLSQSLSELPLIRDQNQYKGIWNEMRLICCRNIALDKGRSRWQMVGAFGGRKFFFRFLEHLQLCSLNDESAVRRVIYPKAFFSVFSSFPCLPETFKPRHKHTANKSHSKQSRL